MATGVYFAVEGYVQLAQWLVDQWGQLATKIAKQLDAGTLTADAATADAGDGALLAAQSLVLVVSEAFDAAAVLGGEQDRPLVVLSHSFATTAGADAQTVRTLRLEGPMVADLGNDQLPTSVVTIVPGTARRGRRQALPSTLQPGENAFHLEVDATGHHAGCYAGTVQVVRDDSGAVIESISVWLAV